MEGFGDGTGAARWEGERVFLSGRFLPFGNNLEGTHVTRFLLVGWQNC